MPLGNGDLAANVWTETNGDIVFYLAKNDAWDDFGRLVKIGRLRVSLKPALLGGSEFKQTLSLEDACITVTNGKATVRLWCDAHWPRFVVEVESDEPCEIRARLDNWRSKPRELTGQETHAAVGMDKGPVTLRTFADQVVPKLRGAVAWYHRNDASIWSQTLELMSLESHAENARDPLLGRTFGGYLQGEGFKSKGRDGLITNQKTRSAALTVTVLCEQTDSVDAWLDLIKERTHPDAMPSLANAWTDHQAWWREFWSRSHIRVESRGPDWGNTEKVCQNLTWHRFMVACCGRGRFPVKFNGALFTADWAINGESFDADYRRWGGGYWWQNTRLIYWTLLANGDYDLMHPLFRMYADMLPLAELRTQRWFGHGGAFFPETQYFWGTHLPSNYGWDRTNREPADIENDYIRRYWVGGLELIALMLETYDHTGDTALLENELLPIARAVLKFYTLHYPNGPDGRLKLAPSQSLETWWETENPLPEIAALHDLLPRLLALPENFLAVSDLGAWRGLAARLPRLPIGEVEGVRRILAAESQESVPKNSENPELYAVFPFKLFGIGRPDLGLAQATYARRMFPDTGGWRQDAVQAALLGLTEPAVFYVIKNYTDGHQPQIRFPGFWGPNYDWTPDFDHGSVGQLAMQTMLVQVVGTRIYLFPAWPAGRWNASFRLHLPQQTTVECELRDGSIVHLQIDPPERRRDIIVLLNQDKTRAADLPPTYPA